MDLPAYEPEAPTEAHGPDLSEKHRIGAAWWIFGIMALTTGGTLTISGLLGGAINSLGLVAFILSLTLTIMYALFVVLALLSARKEVGITALWATGLTYALWIPIGLFAKGPIFGFFAGLLSLIVLIYIIEHIIGLGVWTAVAAALVFSAALTAINVAVLGTVLGTAAKSSSQNAYQETNPAVTGKDAQEVVVAFVLAAANPSQPYSTVSQRQDAWQYIGQIFRDKMKKEYKNDPRAVLGLTENEPFTVERVTALPSKTKLDKKAEGEVYRVKFTSKSVDLLVVRYPKGGNVWFINGVFQVKK